MTAQLNYKQKALIEKIVSELIVIPGIAGVVLGGSYARNRARPDSDIDIGIYYQERARFEISAIRALATQLNDTPNPTVSGFGEWGPWVDGGAWLTIEGQRVDLLYRSLDKVELTLSEARNGRFEVDFWQQPPFGFFGPTVLGEVAIAQILHDPSDLITALKAKVTPMPEELRRAVVQRCLWNTDFGLRAFAPKFVAAGNAYGAAGCFTRFAGELVLAAFALNGVYPINDKTALAEIADFPISVPGFSTRISAILGAIGEDTIELSHSMTEMTKLYRETAELARDMYEPAWEF
jgi:predicted nucleotidyltransferase